MGLTRRALENLRSGECIRRKLGECIRPSEWNKKTPAGPLRPQRAFHPQNNETEAEPSAPAAAEDHQGGEAAGEKRPGCGLGDGGDVGP